MRFAVSLLSFRPGAVGGAETYVRSLLEALPRAAGGDELVAILHPDAARSLATPGFDRRLVPRSDGALVLERMLEAFTPYRARSLERLFGNLNADAVLFPQQSVFPKRAPVRAVLTVHDVQHLTRPQQVGAFDRAFRAGIYGESLRRAARIIAISRFTRDELLARCGTAPERIEVVRQGVRPPPAVRPAPWDGAGGAYLYYPAATWPHKGHDTLFRTYAALRRSGRMDARLVLTGARTSHWRTLSRLAVALRIDRDVLHLGFVAPDLIDRVYAGARAVVFPSQHEGFGLPALEAARLGVPAITSRLEVFEEVGVPAARRIDFADPEQLARALAWEGPAALETVPSTWDDVARATLRVLRAAAAEEAP